MVVCFFASIARICIVSRTLLHAIATFSNHIEKSGTHNATSADVREPQRVAVTARRRCSSEQYGAPRKVESATYTTRSGKRFKKENRKPKGAKPWQFPERSTK